MANKRFNLNNLYLVHSAKGKEWEEHKYVRKEFRNGKYVYYYGKGNDFDNDGFDHIGTKEDADNYYYSEYLKGNISKEEMQKAMEQIREKKVSSPRQFGEDFNKLHKKNN